MRYLKFFEGYLDETYFEISQGEWEQKRLVFTESAYDLGYGGALIPILNEIRRKFPENKFKSKIGSEDSYDFVLGRWRKSWYIHIKPNKKSEKRVVIIPGPDDWFWVRTGDGKRLKYWKCDQMFGLISLLENFFQVPISEGYLDPDNTYYPISWNDYCEIQNSSQENFTEKQRESIIQNLTDGYQKATHNRRDIQFIHPTRIGIVGISRPGLDIWVIIDRRVDEWYTVCLNMLGSTDWARGRHRLPNPEHRWWKCDQWNGLIRLLKDKKIIK